MVVKHKHLYKILLYYIKIITVLTACIYFINTILSCFGIKVVLLNFIGCIALIPLIDFYLLSYVFGYCEYHRMFLHYILINNIFTIIDYYVGIPIYDKSLFIIHIIIAGITIFLILYLYVKHNKKIATKNH